MAILLLPISPLGAQPFGDWTSIGKTPAISAGSDIRVRTSDNKLYRGRFQSASEDGLVLTTSSGEQRLARSAVRRVSLKGPGHRMRNALIGLGVGGGTGVAIGAASDSCKNFCFVRKGAVIGVVGAVGAVAGLVIGAVLPTGGWHDDSEERDRI